MHAREPGAYTCQIWHFQFVHTVQTLNGTFLYAVDQQHTLEFSKLTFVHGYAIDHSPHNFVYQIKEL